MGNNPHANGLCQPLRAWRSGPEYERQDAIDLAENAMGRKLSPAEVSHYWFNKAAEFIRTEPGAWLRLLARKWWLTWNAREVMDTDNIEVYYEQSRVLRVLGCVLHFGVLAPLAMLGAWLTRREWRRLWVLYGTVGLLVASSAVFFVFARYRFPVVPVLALFAGAGIVELLRILRARQGRTLVLAVLLTTATAVAANWPVDIGEQLATSHYNFGAAFRRQGRTPEAIDQYRRALQVEPTHVMALNNLAWILATDTQDAIRDGAQAVLLGRRACEATGWADPAALDTLAAAYAQSGDFTRAVETLRMGLKKAVSGGDAAAISQIQAHLAEFQAGRALRVEPPTIAAR